MPLPLVVGIFRAALQFRGEVLNYNRMEELYLRRFRKRRWLRGRIRFWNKKLLLRLLILLPILLYVLFNNKGVVPRVRLELQKREMEQKIQEAEAKGRRLQEEVKAIEDDLDAIEKVAREKHGMVRKGEKVYRVEKAR